VLQRGPARHRLGPGGVDLDQEQTSERRRRGQRVEQLTPALEAPGTPLERFGRALDVYLDALTSAPAFARLFLVEVHAAGPEAMARRTALQHRLAGAIADLFGARTDADRFTCQAIVAAISALVTGPLVSGDLDAVRRLRQPLVDHVARLLTTAP
jgi:AcrR family transcriptional regulator